ncbi:hypothetical protein AB6A40_001911 [Gnathostoma spinigerum]|uniref:Uncharacterized protein n=1 Tax=Gnathostoma spinigerum TaxID=75299 RepID=A0ABD6EF99_9BILA
MQSESQTDAMNRAKSEIFSAVLIALKDVGVSAPSLEISVDYEPQQISNCYTQYPTPPGTRLGILSSGAITEIAFVNRTFTSGVTFSSCPPSRFHGVTQFKEYTRVVKVKFNGYATSRTNWNRIASAVLATLTMRFHALFRTSIDIE